MRRSSRPDPHLISFSKVSDHARLGERLAGLRAALAASGQDAPDGVASPLLTRAVAAFLADLYRLVSREPGARALPRLAPDAPPSHRRLKAMLADAGLALALFAEAHADPDADCGDEWLTREGLEDLQSRKKTNPRRPYHGL